ncbi:MAG: tRNA glutamyl-Q(34) synthetase GluQRS [Bacteroidales bacterium]|nr:tRNA glutamyl-Q(34) synthetase GluQRS [Candidatus Liminaster caballi]
MLTGRFAPSPTGRMHLGNVYSALLSWLSAKSKGGEWILRIEDIDPQRSKEVFARQIEDDLRWLGLDWDRGGVDDPLYVQSRRGHIYEQYLGRLAELGMTYPCYCSRADILATQAPHESDGRVVYKGTCRPDGTPEKNEWLNLRRAEWLSLRKTEMGKTPAIRIMVPDRDITFTDLHYGTQTVNLAHECGDFILRRSDGAWAYQLAVVVDDALMGVTEVVRGCDLLLSSPQQIFMHELLGFRAPQFCHLPLLCNEQHQRLCKRDKSLDMGELRKHHTAPEIIGLLAYKTGITDCLQPVTPQELISVFDWDKVPSENQILRI